MALALVQELRPQWVGITRKVYQNYIVKRKSTGGDCTDHFLKLFEDMDEQLSSLVVEEASVHRPTLFNLQEVLMSMTTYLTKSIIFRQLIIEEPKLEAFEHSSRYTVPFSNRNE